MVWHDCKTDPPKKYGTYIVAFKCCDGRDWMQGWYYPEHDVWWDYIGEDIKPYKWAEVDLSGVMGVMKK